MKKIIFGSVLIASFSFGECNQFKQQSQIVCLEKVQVDLKRDEIKLIKERNEILRAILKEVRK